MGFNAATDAGHLRWVADRLTKVHGDPVNVDFVLRLRKIADELEERPTTAVVRAFDGYTEQQVSLAMDFLEAIAAERRRAHDKHGATSMEQAPLLAHKRASILTEEAVECAKALNDHEHGEILLQPSVAMLGNPVPTADALDRELIQTAAMAYTWWANRRGDRLAPPEQKPIRGCHTRTLPVIFNGVPYTGVVDPATGEIHVHSVDRLVVEVQDEVSFVRGPSDPAPKPTPKSARGESYEAVELLRQILRETHLMVPTRRKVEALLAAVDEPVREWTFTKAEAPPGLTFNEVSFVTDEPDPSKGVYPLLHVGQPGEVLVRALEVGSKGQGVRCVMVSGGGIYLCELPYDVVPGQTFTVKDPRPVSPPEPPPDHSWVTFTDARGRTSRADPPADDPDGGRRGD